MTGARALGRGSRLLVATAGVTAGAVVLAGCTLGSRQAEGTSVQVEAPGGSDQAAGTSVEVDAAAAPLAGTEVSISPADPGTTVEVVDELPLTTLGAGGAIGGTSVEVRVGELLGSLDTREGTGAGETVVVLPEAILFDFDDDRLQAGAAPTLARVAELIGLSEDGEVLVVGHTDSNGSDAYNDDLSQRRAQAVVDALVEQGVSADRLVPEGRGEREPVEANENPDGSDNPDGRAANRRVEVLVDDLPGQQ